MARSIVNCLNVSFRQVEQFIIHFFNSGFPSAVYAIDINNYTNTKIPVYTPKLPSIKDIIGDGFLWACPTHRRTVEKRRSRKFGYPKYVWKPFVPKTNILMCTNCGHDHLHDTLCPNCYGKIKEETQKMQEAIENELGLEPVEKDVIVLYKGEKKDDFWKNQRIVEIPRKRPSWFCSNLLQQSTEEPTETKSIESEAKELA